MVSGASLQAKPRRDLWVVGGLTVLALALRFYRLTAESLWYDEAYSVWSSAMDIASPRILWEWQIEFPLYYWLLHVWMRLFGQGESAVRAFGALASAASIGTRNQPAALRRWRINSDLTRLGCPVGTIRIVDWVEAMAIPAMECGRHRGHRGGTDHAQPGNRRVPAAVSWSGIVRRGSTAFGPSSVQTGREWNEPLVGVRPPDRQGG